MPFPITSLKRYSVERNYSQDVLGRAFQNRPSVCMEQSNDGLFDFSETTMPEYFAK